MRRYVLPACGCALVAAVGCGPMQMPLPARLDDQTQQLVDGGWDRMLTPPARLDHQDMLDVFVGTGVYQYGVDTLSFRSEKRFAGGSVVMEVRFDRAKPDDDRFEVTVLDPAGNPVRKERYTRPEVEGAYRDLFGQTAGQPDPNDPPEVAARRAAHAARWEKVRGLFPDRPEAVAAPRPKE